MQRILAIAVATVACRAPDPKDPPAEDTHTDGTTPSTPTDPPVDTFTEPTGDTATPTPPTSAYLKLSAGEQLTCGLFTDGEVGCQGSTRWTLPPAPPGPFVDVAAGWDTACAIRDTGTIACWGCDWVSALCNPPAGDQWVALDAADSTFCAMNQEGRIACWGITGWNPPPELTFTAFAVGITGCIGVRADTGEAFAQGEANAPPGELVAIAAGRSAACGIRASDGGTECVWLDGPQPPDGLSRIDGYGTNFCWLDAEAHAGCSRQGPDPVRDGFDPATEAFGSLTTGQDHACGVTTDGRGFCWPRDGRPETSGIPEVP